MPDYTYFIISPGVDESCYVQYPDGTRGNYIKFGDATSSHEDSQGVRSAYLTHNPDIGIAAVMDSTALTSKTRFGTQLKKYIQDLEYNPVGNTEWFSVKTGPAWELFRRIAKFDNKKLNEKDGEAIRAAIDEVLGEDG